ncbi:MAG: amidohydrolase family protein [Deltaproteobacteria bacterium]|nr:amidohydrolase family protein [Candidatus Tharpella sp.]
MQNFNQSENFSADYLVRAAAISTMVPGQRPIDNGALLIQATSNGDRIKAVGSYHSLQKESYHKVVDLGAVTIAPGLINAHTHLEISHLAGLTVGGQGFVPWLKSLVPHLNQPPDDEALNNALKEMQSCGTVFAADMAGRHADQLAIFLRKNNFGHWLMVQHFGFATPDIGTTLPPTMAESLNSKLANSENFCRAGHAFYSTNAATLQAAKSWNRQQQRPFALHLAESSGESELLINGRGELADFFRAADILPPDFRPPGSSPVAYADKLQLLDEMTLAIHCIELDQSNIDILARRRVNVCLCPRSNAFIGVGRAPWEKLHKNGVNLCLGTDSLTSNHNLNLWHELEFLLAEKNSIMDLETGLKMLTLNPAQALSIDTDFGTLEPGKKALWSIVPEVFL